MLTMRRSASFRFAAFVLGAGLLLSWNDESAHASRITYRDVSLRDAVAKASLIVCARFLGNDAATHGPHRFRVGRVLRGTGAEIGQEIHVFTLEAWAWSVVRQAHAATGVHRSPLLDRLPAPLSAALSQDAHYCLLLARARGSDYRLAVSGGHVAAPCSEVSRLLARDPSPGGGGAPSP